MQTKPLPHQPSSKLPHFNMTYDSFIYSSLHHVFGIEVKQVPYRFLNIYWRGTQRPYLTFIVGTDHKSSLYRHHLVCTNAFLLKRPSIQVQCSTQVHMRAIRAYCQPYCRMGREIDSSKPEENTIPFATYGVEGILS